MVEGLKEAGSKINDKVTQIKLAETIANIRKIKSVKKIREQHLSALMMTYELLNEYVSNEVTKLINALKEVGSKVTDKVTQIKLAETISNIRKVKSIKRIY